MITFIDTVATDRKRLDIKPQGFKVIFREFHPIPSPYYGSKQRRPGFIMKCDHDACGWQLAPPLSFPAPGILMKP